MYTIYALVGDNRYLIHNPRMRTVQVGSPYFELADNLNGQAEFLVYKTHPYYAHVKKLTTEIVVMDEDDEVFRGRVLYDDEDMNGTKHVFVEGQLGYLNDSIQRPAVYRNVSISTYLGTLLENHNAQVEEGKKFYLGRVTVTDSNNSIYRYSNWETTRKCLKEKLVDRLGGHFVIRWGQDGLRYLDYLADYDYYSDCEQPIMFGKNMLDYSKTITAADIATCIIPLGYRLPEEQQDPTLQEQRLTIESVNGGVDYVTDNNAIAMYGKIFKTVINDDVTTATYLKAWGENYLSTVQYEKLVLELKAVDLGLINEDLDRFKVGKRIHCISEPHGMDVWLPLTKMRIYLTKYEQNTVTIGNESVVASYTSSNAQTTGDLEKTIQLLPTKKEILEQAIRDATAMLNAYCTGGYAIHTPNEFIVADNTDPEEAVNLWRWGLGGLAHYSQGYDGPVDGIALTMDGKINGNMILANSIAAASIDLGYRTSVEKAISDGDEQVVTELENSITNAENRIRLYASSEARRMSMKEYVTNGEQETLDISSFTVTGNGASVTEAQFLNLSCFKVQFNSSSTVYISQDLGNLPAGTYLIEVTFAFPLDSDGLTTLRPTSLAYGFSGNLRTVSLSTYTGNEMHTVQRALEITAASKTISVAVNGAAGTILYVTNIRVLRDLTELIEDVSAELTVQADSIRSTVTSLYENMQHNYCSNSNFSDSSNYYEGWVRSNESYVVRTTYSGKSCLSIANQSSGNQYAGYSFEVPKVSDVKVRFKVACRTADVGTANAEVLIGSKSIFTDDGFIGSTWKTFDVDFSNVPAGTRYVYIRNTVSNTTIYITDVEILGYGSAYYESQIKQNADAIRLRVTSSQAQSLIEQSADAIRLKANNIAWTSTYSSMTSDGKLTCTSADIKGKITSTDGEEDMVLDSSMLIGKHEGAQCGYLDLSAYYNSGYEVALGSQHDMYLEIGGSGTLYIVQISGNTKYTCGYFDRNGWHGDVHGTVHAT